MTSLLYTAELDLAEEDTAPFLSWYAFRHAPELYPLGFQTCACYRTVGADMNLFDIYQIPGVQLFAGAGYRRMNERDRYAAAILEKRRDKAHTIYAQLPLAGGWEGAEPPLDADWISVARFDAPGEPADVAAALSGDVAHWRSLGATVVRVSARATDHPIYTTRRPRFMIVIEWPDAPPATADLANRLRGGLGNSVAHLDAFEATRLFPWPDQPEQG